MSEQWPPIMQLSTNAVLSSPIKVEYPRVGYCQPHGIQRDANQRELENQAEDVPCRAYP